jgi:dihydroneopterin aldolase
MDDDEYFKAMGTASNLNMQNARTAAFDAAKSMLNKRLGGYITGLSTDYSRTVAGDAQQDKVQRMMEGEFYQVVERMLNDAAKTCEKMYQNKTGAYESFIAIRVSKKELINQMANKLSDNQELEIEFNREQFRKFAEKKMKEIMEMRKK